METLQELIKEYNKEQELYAKVLDWRYTTDELLVYMTFDEIMGRENERGEKEYIGKLNKLADEWENDLKQRLDEIAYKYKKLTGRDIKEDLEDIRNKLGR